MMNLPLLTIICINFISILYFIGRFIFANDVNKDDYRQIEERLDNVKKTCADINEKYLEKLIAFSEQLENNRKAIEFIIVGCKDDGKTLDEINETLISLDKRLKKLEKKKKHE